MTHAKDRETLITATEAFMPNPYTVRLAGNIEVTVGEFEEIADKFVSLLAKDGAAAAKAVELAAMKGRSLAST